MQCAEGLHIRMGGWPISVHGNRGSNRLQIVDEVVVQPCFRTQNQTEGLISFKKAPKQFLRTNEYYQKE